MKLGFIKSNFPNERRVPLLPFDINNFENELYIENGFGSNLGILDQEYKKRGATILSREEIFKKSEAIFSLKLIQPIDYDFIQNNQFIIGWTHPLGSGKKFMKEQAIPKKLAILDLDNRSPMLYYNNKVKKVKSIPENTLFQNSFYAGYSAVVHALLSFGLFPDQGQKIAVLGSGNVSQGAFYGLAKFSQNIRLFYRRTLNQFKKQIKTFDIIVNGIENDNKAIPILSLEEQKQLKEGCLIIDAAADAGNAIEGTKFTTIDEPLYEKNGHYFYVVPNTPSLVFRNISQILSKQFSSYVYKKDVQQFLNLIDE